MINDVIAEIETYLVSKGKYKPYYFRSGKLEQKFPDLYKKINDLIKDDVPLIEKIVAIHKNNGKLGYCLVCGSKTNYFASYGNFARYCSITCEQKSEERKEIGRKNINPVFLQAKYIEKYGCNPMQITSVKQKMKMNNLEKYGVENTFQLEKARHKASINAKTTGFIRGLNKSNNFAQKTGLNKDLLLQEYVKNKNSCEFIGKKLNVSTTKIWKDLIKFEIPINYSYRQSSCEKELVEFLTGINIKTKTNVRNIIYPKEIDIFLPDFNVAIEINGLYWHHDVKKHRSHLLEKQNLCKEKNIRLLHFWDIEIDRKPEIVKSIISSSLGFFEKTIYARKCEIRNLDNKSYKEFLDENHIQGFRGSSIKYGLFYNDELVSVMGWNKIKTGYELTRFANKTNHKIIGGASKLFSKRPQGEIISFCDKRLFQGQVYEKLGFEYSHDSTPNYFYFSSKEYKLQSRVKFQKHKLKNILNEFDETKSEYENMISSGFLRIFDCGNKVYKYKQE